MFAPESNDLRTVKALPFWQAFLGGVLGPVIIAVVFGLLGSRTSPLLMQVELLLVAIAFCLTGILARSKLIGLLSIISAPIAWILLYVLDLVTAGMIANPFGLFSGLSGPMNAIIETGLIPGLEEFGSAITTIAMILDLVIVEIIAFFLGFFISTVATGIWTKKGELSIFSVIMKPVAAFFVIVILILVPFTYHGLANLAYGGVSIGAGASEFMQAFGFDAGGGAQNGDLIDFNDPNVIGNLSLAAERAEKWFKESSVAFKQFQENFLVNFLIDSLFPEGSDFQGINMQQATGILDIAKVLTLISGELPELFAGYQNLVRGFNLAFSVLGNTDLGGGFGSSADSIQSVVYDPSFSLGLDKIGAAVDNFTDAQTGVLGAVSEVKDILNEVIVGEGTDLGIVIDIIDEVDVGYGILLQIALGGIDFLNATYKTTLAVEELGESDFPGANFWLNDAALELREANETMQNIDSSGLDPASQLPFWGTVEILKDMTNLLGWFAMAAANGTQVYTAMNNTLVTLQELDFTSTAVLLTDWNTFASNVASARVIFNDASSNIGIATGLSTSFTTKTYGNIIDASLKPMLLDFSSMMTSFSQNITEMDYLIGALADTVTSIQSFTEGFSLFNQSYTSAVAGAGGDAPTFFNLMLADPDFNRSEDLMGFSKMNASIAYSEVELATLIDITVKTTWQNTLWYPGPPAFNEPDVNATIKSIAGLAQGVLDTITGFKVLGAFATDPSYLDAIQTYFEAMNDVGLDAIFGGG
ncbi:MAG: hypothetical protein ACW98F_13195 [Candidatus Hodarchaeales archaeon]|jgi:hypothetical protein